MPSTFTPIQSISLTSTTATVSFSSIPQTYTDFVIYFSARGSTALTDRTMLVYFNGSTASNYSYTQLTGDPSVPSTGSNRNASAQAYFTAGRFSGDAATAKTFGVGEIYVPGYTSSRYKIASSVGVTENNSSSTWLQVDADLWSITDAITSVTLYPSSGSFVAGSTFHLYGISNS